MIVKSKERVLMILFIFLSGVIIVMSCTKKTLDEIQTCSCATLLAVALYIEIMKHHDRNQIKRFLFLNDKLKALEDDGCLKRDCAKCKHIIRYDGYMYPLYTCIREKYTDEMLLIYSEFHPNEDMFDRTFNEKVQIMKELREGW